MLGAGIRPGLSKPKCLKAFLGTKSVRGYGLQRAGEFLSKFPWFGFLLQAPQALFSLTGYGLIFGGVMGFLSDLFWTPFRLLQGEKVRIEGPPPSDPVGKAARYVLQPAYHYSQGQLFSYDDHWLLTAADIVATGLLMREYKVDRILPRLDLIAAGKPPRFEPWYLPTRAALFSEGLLGVEDSRGPLDDSVPDDSVLSITQKIGRDFPEWLQRFGSEVPLDFEGTALQAMIFEAGEDVFTWANSGVVSTKAIYSPEEIAVARCFEYGIFPAFDPAPEQMELFTLRAVQLAEAAGREFPGPGEVKRAAVEAWGSFVRS